MEAIGQKEMAEERAELKTALTRFQQQQRGKWLKSRNGAAKRIDIKWLRKEIQRKLLNPNLTRKYN